MGKVLWRGDVTPQGQQARNLLFVYFLSVHLPGFLGPRAYNGTVIGCIETADEWNSRWARKLAHLPFALCRRRRQTLVQKGPCRRWRWEIISGMPERYMRA